MRRKAIIASAITLLIAVALGVWHNSYEKAIEQLRQGGYANLDRIIGQFEGNLAQFRTLATLVARQPDIVEMASNSSNTYLPKDYLSLTAAVSGASQIVLYNAAGYPLSTHAQTLDSESTHKQVTSVFDTPYFERAMTGALGFEYVYNELTDSRRFIFARSVLGQTFLQLGVVAVEVTLERFENEWSSLKETVIFVDKNNNVVLSNRAAMLHKRLVTSASDSLVDNTIYIGEFANHSRLSKMILPIGSRTYGSEMLQRGVPIYDLRAFVFVDDSAARNAAYLTMALACALVGFILSILYTIWIHQRHLVAQFQSEHNLTIELENRVEEKSKQLQATQHDLVQAAKLTALGNMSAGIGHELNQPIGAIKNFAINGQRLLERQQLELVSENLEDIAAQSDRMARIISHLRAFARHEPMEVTDVDLIRTTNSALNLVKDDLISSGITVTFQNNLEACAVRGGKVRLEQVIVNIVTNAIDAMKGSNQKVLTVCIERNDFKSQLIIKDTGTGVQNPDSVFEPFYTTKSVSQGDGLGLGLSISHGIINSLSGQLMCRNHEHGAIFTIELQNAEGE